MTTAPRISDDATLHQLADWLEALEGERIEFKEAKNSYEFDKLARYLCALANEGGGRVLLGVTDKRPRRVVGSQAFPQIERLRAGLLDRLPLRIGVREIHHPDGRVLDIEVASRPIGKPAQVDGRFWCRRGDELDTLTEARLRSIFAESGHDFSADICAAATWDDLDPQSVEAFRRRWAERARNPNLESCPAPQLLRDAELWVDDRPTYAALVLFGTRKALGRHLAQSEVVFEYRSSEAAGPAQQRKEYREGFFAFHEDIWNTINLRNDLQHYQEGLFILDVPTFAERSVREAILNAVSHRDYQLAGSVFVRQYSRRLVIESPGGLPIGITLDNLLDRQSPRNRRIAEAFARCGLVERSGQGMNLMFEQSIRQGKSRPDFTGTDDFHVVITLHGEVTDARFLQFLERVGRAKGISFDTHDLMVLDLVHHEQPVPKDLRSRLQRLRDVGVVETVGRGRGIRYLLARHFYAEIGERATYTRRRGLDEAANKQLLLQHLRLTGDQGCQLAELQQVLPALSREQVKRLLRGLRRTGHARMSGKLKGGRWFASGGTP